MAKYKATDTDLVAVAGAIRDKSGATANLTWPDDYIKWIGALTIDPLEMISDLNVSNILNDNSWDIIDRVSKVGLGDEFWDIGDRKQIILNGAIGSYLTLSNYTTYVFILDFNHPINKTTSDNNIIFGGFMTALSGGKNICLCDSGYNSQYQAGAKYFNFNHYGTSSSPYTTNYGGWKGSDIRYDILGATSSPPSVYGSTMKTTANIGYDATQNTITSPVANTLMAALPSDFRTVLKLWNRYIDNKGNSSNVDANCSTPTVDAGISLIAEFEVFGVRTKANQYEQNHQQQFTYYINSNSKIKYKHNATGTAAIWQLASVTYNSNQAMITVTSSGTNDDYLTRRSLGLAPIFKV